MYSVQMASSHPISSCYFYFYAYPFLIAFFLILFLLFLCLISYFLVSFFISDLQLPTTSVLDVCALFCLYMEMYKLELDILKTKRLIHSRFHLLKIFSMSYSVLPTVECLNLFE